MRCRHLIFLLLLFSLVLFLAGFRLGKKIEQINKTSVFSSSPTPSPKPLQFNTFLSTDCRIKFLYPAFFIKEKSATNEGKLTFKEEKIYFSCQKEKIEEFNKNKKDLAKHQEITFADQKIIIYQDLQKTHFLFTLLNPKTEKFILFNIPKNLLNLFFETLKFP